MGTDDRQSVLEAAVGLKLLSTDWVRHGLLHTIHRKQAYVQKQKTEQEMPKYPKKIPCKGNQCSYFSVRERRRRALSEARWVESDRVYTLGTLTNVKLLHIRQQVQSVRYRGKIKSMKCGRIIAYLAIPLSLPPPSLQSASR